MTTISEEFVSKYYRYRIGASAIIYLEDLDKIVLIKERRYRNAEEIVIWSLPGGLIEPQEDIITGIEREVLEETNLTVEGDRILAVRNWSKSGSNYPGDSHSAFGVHFFIGCKFIKGDPIPQAEEEIYEIRYVDPSDIYHYNLNSTQTIAIEKYLKGEGLRLEVHINTSVKDYRLEFY